MVAPEIEKILILYRSALASALGARLERVLVYGSQARGDAAEGSDIDVLCVIRGPYDYGEMLERTSETTAAISLQHDVVLSRTFVSSEDFESRQLPFLMNVRKEGIAL